MATKVVSDKVSLSELTPPHKPYTVRCLSGVFGSSPPQRPHKAEDNWWRPLQVCGNVPLEREQLTYEEGFCPGHVQYCSHILIIANNSCVASFLLLLCFLWAYELVRMCFMWCCLCFSVPNMCPIASTLWLISILQSPDQAIHLCTPLFCSCEEHKLTSRFHGSVPVHHTPCL